MLELLFAAACCSPAAAGDASAEVRFEEGRERVHRLMEREKWERALDELLALLDEHEGGRYVLTELFAIRDDITQCAFRASSPEPELSELISGELLSYRESSGKLKLRYVPGTLADFDAAGERVLVHPLTFAGTYRVELAFESYPSHGRDYPIFLVGVGAADEAGFAVFHGRSRESVGNGSAWYPSVIRRRDARSGESEEVDRDENPPVHAGEPTVLAVKVQSGSIAAYANGKKYMSARQPKGEWGRLAIVNLPSGGTWSELVIEGEVQPSWLQGVRDAALQERRAAFEESFDADGLLPGWMKASAGAGSRAVARQRYPGPEDEVQTGILDELEDLLDGGDLRQASDLVEALAGRGVSEAFRSFLETRLHLARGEPERAREGFARLLALAPDERPTRLVEASLMHALGRAEAAVDALRDVLVQDPTDVEAVAELARLLLLAGRPADAKQAFDEAIRAGLHPDELGHVHGTVAKALDGPTLARRYEHVSKHYHVVTDIDRTTAYEAAGVLEDAHQRYDAVVSRLSREERRYRVFIFSGEAGYHAYMDDVMGGHVENTAGIYNGHLKQLLIWNLPDAEQLERTVRHEGFHQYFDRLVDDAPVWLNEGLAEYYEEMHLERGRWRIGEPRHDHLRVALETWEQRGELADFVGEGWVAFRERGSPGYAHAWCLIHFMLNSTPENARAFRRLLDALIDGRSRHQALDAAFEELDLQQLDRDLRAHVRALLE